MQLSPAVGPLSAPAPTPAPPARWSRWYTSPIAKVVYGEGSRMPLFPEARIAADRGVSGPRIPAVTYAGSTLEAAVAAAKLLTAKTVDVDVSYRNGRVGTAHVHPAIAILRDAKAGAFWLAPLQTTVQLRGEWVDAPHTIDGPAFEGAKSLLRGATVLSATRDMVAVVGKDSILRPATWTDAPDDSRLDD
jgi:hypothetical protein